MGLVLFILAFAPVQCFELKNFLWPVKRFFFLNPWKVRLKSVTLCQVATEAEQS